MAALIIGILAFPIPCNTPLEMLDIPFIITVITPSIIKTPAVPSVDGNKSAVIGPASAKSPTLHGIEINILSHVALSIFSFAVFKSPLAYAPETSGIIEVGAVLDRVRGMLIMVKKKPHSA